MIAHVFLTLPFVVRAVGPVLQEVDKSQEEAAKTLGANEAQIFVNVILPAIKWGLITGCVFTFTRSLGEFQGHDHGFGQSGVEHSDGAPLHFL